MCLVETNIVVTHIKLWHHSFVYLFAPEGEDGHSIPESSIDIHQVICLELFPSVLFLCCSWQPLLDEKGGTLGKVLGVVVPKGAEEESPTTTRMVGITCAPLLCDRAATGVSSSPLLSTSSRGVHEVCEYIVVIPKVNCGSGQKSLVGVNLIEVMRRVCSISCEGSGFFCVGDSFFLSSPAPPSPLCLLTLLVGFMTGIGASCPDPCFVGGCCLCGGDCCC